MLILLHNTKSVLLMQLQRYKNTTIQLFPFIIYKWKNILSIQGYKFLYWRNVARNMHRIDVNYRNIIRKIKLKCYFPMLRCTFLEIFDFLNCCQQ